jgi:hypothetical protein
LLLFGLFAEEASLVFSELLDWTTFDDFPFFHNDDSIELVNVFKTVSDHKQGFILSELEDLLVQQSISFGVHIGGSFIKTYDVSITQNHS